MFIFLSVFRSKPTNGWRPCKSPSQPGLFVTKCFTGSIPPSLATSRPKHSGRKYRRAGTNSLKKLTTRSGKAAGISAHYFDTLKDPLEQAFFLTPLGTALTIFQNNQFWST